MLGGVVAAAGCSTAGPEEPPRESTVPRGRVYEYQHLDVFTDQPLTGNQLAVFLDPNDLETDEMQAMTREINFSETTFVVPAETEDTDVRVRIFGRNREMQFAGHPTIGTAFALAQAGRIASNRAAVATSSASASDRRRWSWNGWKASWPSPGWTS